MAAPFNHAKVLGKLMLETSSFLDEKSRHKSNICGQPFNCAVDVLLPGSETLPSDFEKCLTENQTYFAKGVPVQCLLEPEFIEGFVKRGKLYCLSHGTNVDIHDCLAILPSGQLVLHLCKDTYQELGLQGTPSIYHRKDRMKYVVTVNLTAPHFVPGKKLYDRVKWCLTDRLGLTFDLMCSWFPKDTKVCSSSIQNYFKIKNVVCSRMEVSKRVRNYKQLAVPVISPDQPVQVTSLDGETEGCHYPDVFEWLGACSTEIDMSAGGPDSYVSSYTCPTPNTKMDRAISCQYTGMFIPEVLIPTLDLLRSYVKTRNLPWCSMTVHGFMDSPVAGGLKEHGFYNNGDNVYTFVIFPQQTYWLYTATGSQSLCS